MKLKANVLKVFLAAFVVLVLSYGCKESQKSYKSYSKEYLQVLNASYVPKGEIDWDGDYFSDLGSWQSYSLPTKAYPELLGGFCGPLVHITGKWVSKQLVNLSIFDLDKKEYLDKKEAYDISLNHYPGLIEQSYSIGKIRITHMLFFISSETALVTTHIKNKGNRRFHFSVRWKGETFLSEHNMAFNKKEFIISFGDGPAHLRIVFPSGIEGEVKKNRLKNGFELEAKNHFTLLPRTTKTLHWAQSLILDKGAEEKEKSLIKKSFLASDLYFGKNRERWDNYIASVKVSDDFLFAPEQIERAKVKCIMTLIHNWRRPYADLKHAGVFPSSNVWYFNGFWAWDSWKHAVALVKFEEQLAKDQVITMFDYQNEKGMIADCIYSNATENNWRNTKPPLAAWAVWEIYKKSRDTTFLINMYPKLRKYHQWWYKYRDYDKNGLCEFGATDGTLEAAAWESGMDNAVRFDGAKMLRDLEREWSVNQESVDLNAFLFKEKILLAKIAGIVLDNKAKESYQNDALVLKEKINTLMFDNQKGYYFDKKVESTELIKTEGPEGWIPLWAGIATKEQASKVKQIIISDTLFNSYLPFPTLNISNVKLEPAKGYWRGPVWIDQAYFAINGLENYGQFADAERLKVKLFKHLDGLLGMDKPLRENYNPLTGEGLNARHFSWTAAHLLMLMTE